MKILKIINNLFQPQNINKFENAVSPCPIIYDRNNVTAKEFREYIHQLAENHINRNVCEPDRFISEAERAILEKKKLGLEEYRNFVRYLAENNINRTFYC